MNSGYKAYEKVGGTARKLIGHKEKVMSVTFSLVAIFFGALIASGFRFEWETLISAEFWIKTASNYFIMMMVFNAFKRDIIIDMKHRSNSEYKVAKERTDRYVKYVHDHHLEQIIHDEAYKETERRKEAAIERELNRYTNGLRIIDGYVDYGLHPNTKKPLDQKEYFKLKEIRGHKKRLAKKSIRKAVNGEVVYVAINGYQVLNGVVGYGKDGCEDAVMTMDEREENIKENLSKSVMFLAVSAVMAIILWDSINGKLLQSLLQESSVVLTSILSAIGVAYKRIENLIIILVNRAAFLNDHVKIIENDMGCDLKNEEQTHIINVERIDTPQM